MKLGGLVHKMDFEKTEVPMTVCTYNFCHDENSFVWTFSSGRDRTCTGMSPSSIRDVVAVS